MKELKHLDTKSKDVFRAEIDGKKVKTVKSFYAKIGKALHFPDYFSHNLDSLDEMLCDLEWIDPKKVQVVIVDSTAFLSKEKAEKKADLMDVLQNATENQMDDTRTFELILQ